MKLETLFYGLLEPARLITSANNNISAKNNGPVLKEKTQKLQDDLQAVWSKVSHTLPIEFNYNEPDLHYLE